MKNKIISSKQIKPEVARHLESLGQILRNSGTLERAAKYNPVAIIRSFINCLSSIIRSPEEWISSGEGCFPLVVV
jgi:hypothetical protein